MRTTSLLRAIPLSFYSKALYREAATAWPGLGFTYLLLVNALVGLVFAGMLMLALVGVTLDQPVDMNHLLEQLPPLEFHQGELTVEVAQPYTLQPAEGEGFRLIIDTTTPVSEWDTPAFRGAVLGKRQLLVQTGGHHEAKLYAYPAELNRTITRDDARGFLEQWLPRLWWLGLLAYPFIVLSFFLYRILQMLLYGLPGLAMAKLAHVPLTYPALVRLASVSITPLLIVETLALLLQAVVPWWAALLCAMVYLYFAISSNGSRADVSS